MIRAVDNSNWCEALVETLFSIKIITGHTQYQQSRYRCYCYMAHRTFRWPLGQSCEGSLAAGVFPHWIEKDCLCWMMTLSHNIHHSMLYSWLHCDYPQYSVPLPEIQIVGWHSQALKNGNIRFEIFLVKYNLKLSTSLVSVFPRQYPSLIHS